MSHSGLMYVIGCALVGFIPAPVWAVAACWVAWTLLYLLRND